MIPAGPMITELCDQMNNPRGQGDAVYLRQVTGKLNQAYRDVANGFNWGSLRRVVDIDAEVDPDGVVDGGYVLPSDLRTVVRVKDDGGLEYNFVSGAKERSDYSRNWYFGAAIAAAWASGTTAGVGEYATVVTSDSEFGGVSCADEYIRIADNTGVYRISSWTDESNIALVHNFRGAAQGNVMFQIRPIGTPVLYLSDAKGNLLGDIGAITVTYYRHVLPVYRDEDVLELPGSCEAVGIRALQHLLAQAGFNQAADRKKDEYVAALSAMRANENQSSDMGPTSMFADRFRYARQDHGWMRGLSLMNR